MDVDYSGFAIYAHNVEKSYGTKSVLRNMRLLAKSGCIYSLLGPSGCGKTTFLNCILGAIMPTSGELIVLGQAPGSPGHSVPGVDIGYMPQNIALIDEFTVQEMFYFYAKLNNVPERDLQERSEFLIDFLELPRDDRPVKTFSGGQQRRVSLAVSLIHNPAIVLLDEPTVGVDPTLRAKIWVYLRKLASQGTTIIITTHYIEEARQADTVGFMRAGRMLEQGPPGVLIAKYNMKTLEQTFLHLCNQRDQTLGHEENPDEDDDEVSVSDSTFSREKTNILASSRGGINSSAASAENGTSVLLGSALMDNSREIMQDEARAILNAPIDPEVPDYRTSTSASVFTNDHNPLGANNASPSSDGDDEIGIGGCHGAPRRNKTVALIWKTYKKMIRNYAFLIFQFLLPALQVTLFCVAIGKNPTSLNIGVVGNKDTYGNVAHFITDYLSKDSDLDLSYYDNAKSAHKASKAGKNWGYITFADNFSECYTERYVKGSATETIIACSTVYMSLDLSNQQISAFVQTEIAAAFEASILKFAPAASSSFVPIYLSEAIYGSKTAKFTDFIAPGIIIAIAFSQSIGLTAMGFVLEKKTGNMDRLYAAGIRASEIMIAQTCAMAVLLLIQMIILLLVALFIFSLPMHGSFVLVMLVAILLGMVGMMFGLVIAAGAETEEAANQLVLGTFFPCLLLSGVIWPVEAVPVPLNWVSLALPTTWAASAMRSIMTRGWGISNQEVYLAFVVNFAWLFFLFFVAARNLSKIR